VTQQSMVISCLWLSDVSVICRLINPHPLSQKSWGGFLYGVYRPGDDTELIPTVKMETRNPVEGYFGSEFPVICNQCGVIVAWSRKTLNIFEKFCRFVEKRPHAVNFLKVCSESVHCDTDWRVVFIFRSKSATTSPPQCTQSAPDFIQIGSLLAES